VDIPEISYLWTHRRFRICGHAGDFVSVDIPEISYLWTYRRLRICGHTGDFDHTVRSLSLSFAFWIFFWTVSPGIVHEIADNTCIWKEHLFYCVATTVVCFAATTVSCFWLCLACLGGHDWDCSAPSVPIHRLFLLQQRTAASLTLEAHNFLQH